MTSDTNLVQRGVQAEKAVAETLAGTGSATIFAFSRDKESLKTFFTLAGRGLAVSLTGEANGAMIYPYAQASSDAKWIALLLFTGHPDAQTKLVGNLNGVCTSGAYSVVQGADVLAAELRDVRGGRYRLLDVNLNDYEKDLSYTRVMGRAPTLSTDELAQKIELRLSSLWVTGDPAAKQSLMAMIEKQAKAAAETKQKRKDKGLCVMCGKALGWFARTTGRDAHAGCTSFTADEPAADSQDLPLRTSAEKPSAKETTGSVKWTIDAGDTTPRVADRLGIVPYSPTTTVVKLTPSTAMKMKVCVKGRVQCHECSATTPLDFTTLWGCDMGCPPIRCPKCGVEIKCGAGTGTLEGIESLFVYAMPGTVTQSGRATSVGLAIDEVTSA